LRDLRHVQTQIVVLKKGIWIGQQAARDIGVNKTAQKGLFGFGHFATDRKHNDTWFEPYNSSEGASLPAVHRSIN
jgi:hypothetical protein